MKRSRSQVSREMSPSIDGEGFPLKAENNEILGLKETNGAPSNNGVGHVTVIGAGPAGLMLAYVVLKAHMNSVP